MTWRRFYAFFRFAGVKGQAGELAAGASFLPQFDSFLTLAGGRLTFKSLTRLNTTYDTLRSVSRTGDALRGREARQTSAQPYAGDTPAREIVDIVDGHFVVEDSPAAPSRVDSVNTGSYNGDSNLRLRNITATEASGSPVTISAAPLKSAENGRVVLNTTSGAVDMNSVSFENPVVPLLYQYAAQEYGTATGNAFLSGYESAKGQNAGLDIAEYKSAFDRIAESSRQGMQEDSLRKRYAGEIDQIGDVAFLYAEAAGQTIKNAGESSIYVGRETQRADRRDNRDRAGSLWASEGLETEAHGETEGAEENVLSKVGGKGEARRINNAEYQYAKTSESAKSERSKALQAEFDELGIESTVIDGKAEVTRNGVKTVLGGEATTIADGSVLVRNDGESTAPTRRISGHEFFHVAEKSGRSQTFRKTVSDGGVNPHSAFFEQIHDAIVAAYGEDFSAFENPQKFYNEFCAFVSGDIFENDGHLSEKFSEMFRDPAAVEAAWADMRAQFKGNTVSDHSAQADKTFRRTAKRIAKRTGLDIQIRGSEMTTQDGKRAYGKYESGRVTISLSSPNLYSTLFHELTHWLHDTSPKSYGDYESYLLDYLFDGNEDARESILQKYQEKYSTDRAGAVEELAAETAESILKDKVFLSKVLSTNRTLFEKIWDFFADITDKISEYLYKHEVIPAIAERANRNLESVTRLRDLWAAAYSESVKAAKSKNADQTAGEVRYSKQMGGYFPSINTSVDDVADFGISNLRDISEVKRKVYSYLENRYISTDEISRPIVNIDTQMAIEIRKNGINETFGNAKAYKYLSLHDKKIKLATMKHLAKLIKYGEVRAKEASNYHNSKSEATYAYLTAPITVDGVTYNVDMDIRKSPRGNRFYIHKIKIADGSPRSGKSRIKLNNPSADPTISQDNSAVNTQYMQGSEKNAKSSIADFSTDEEIRALLEKYGALPRGEKAAVDVEVPAKTSDNKKVMRFTRTLLESGTITDDLADTIKQGVLTEALSYTPYGDEKAISYANNTIKNQGVEYAKDEWASVANGNGQVTKGKVAIGERLLQMAAKDGDKAAVMKYAAEMAEVGTRLGQSVQAYSLLKKMGGAGELVYIKRAVDRLNNQFLKKNSNKPEPI